MDHAANIDIEAAKIGIETACIKADDRTLFNVPEDVQILFHIIEMTENEKVLFLIIHVIENIEILEEFMELSGDFGTLRSIFEIIEATRGLKLLNMELPEDINTLRNIGEIINNTRDLKFNKHGRTFSHFELNTALISSCHRGYTFLVRGIVRLGADKETRDRNGNTPLLICIENGFIRTAKCLINRNVMINTANDFGDSALMLAAHSIDSVEIAKYLLAQKGISVNHQNREGYTALMKAIEARNFIVIKLILDSQKNPADVLEGIQNCRSETGQDMADKLGIGQTVKLLIKQNTKAYNPILAAVLMCDMDSFDILMDCPLYEPSDKKCFIKDSFCAVFYKHKKSGEKFSEDEEKIIQRLLQHGADVNVYSDSFNPFMIAASVGSCNMLRILLYNKANLQRLCTVRPSAERGHADFMELLIPALISAMKNGHCCCVELLKQHGACLDIKCAFESFVKDNDAAHLKYLVENFKAGIHRAVSAKVMDNFLVDAARTGHIDIIGLLIDANANVNFVNGAKRTPLMEAQNAEVVNFLVQRGAAVNNKITERDQVYSPLTYVLSKGYYQCKTTEKVKIIEALLKNGASVNEDCGGNSPLMTAIINKADKNIIQLLLDYGADVTVRDGRGNTVLLNAAENSSAENIECLLQQHKVRNMINVQNHKDSTALMVSARNSDHSAVKVLIHHGADVNMKDEDGNTTLMLALSSHRQDLDVLTTLIQAGSDINSQNNNGHSVLMLAAYASWDNAVSLVVDSGADVNAVGGNNETALSLAVISMHPRSSCAEYLLDHGASALNVKPELLFQLILKRHMKFIPKLIQGGIGPIEVYSHYIGPLSVTPVSPLCLALMTGNVKLASYFVENLFVTKSDMFTLIHHRDVRHHLHRHKLHECLGFLDKQAAQPLSLFSLAFISVQSAVGSAPGREERIGTLPLPSKLKDRLLFKTEVQPLDTSTYFYELAAHNNITREWVTFNPY